VRKSLTTSLFFVLIACSREAPDVTNTTPSQSSTNVVDPRTAETSTLNPVMPPQSALPTSQPSGSASATQTVQLTEYSIGMPDTLTAGAQNFTIVNGGKELHSFEIEGNGVEVKLPSDLPRGNSATLAVNLPAGTYKVYCPIKGHEAKGMVKTVTVR
jgi:hypothetical protein